MVHVIVALRGQVPGAEPPLQVIDIGGEGLAEAAERNGGAVGGWGGAVLAALVNLEAWRGMGPEWRLSETIWRLGKAEEVVCCFGRTGFGWNLVFFV